MTKYKYGIVNNRMILRIVGLMMISFSLFLYFLFRFVDLDLSNKFIIIILVFILLLGSLIIWLRTKNFKDNFHLSINGIESEHHDIIKWEDIKYCSWETYRGGIYIYLKLKNKKQVSISRNSSRKGYSNDYNELRNLFEEIKTFRENLSENEKFQIYEDKLTNSMQNCEILIKIILVAIILVAIMIKYGIKGY